MKFFFSNAPQFAALPDGGANVPGFGADRKNDNRLFSVQNIPHLQREDSQRSARWLQPRQLGQLRATPGKGLGRWHRRANADAYPGLGLIRIGAGQALTIGNSGNFVDVQANNSAITLADILNHRASQHPHGRRVIYYRTDVTTNNNRRGVIIFQSFNHFCSAWLTARRMLRASTPASCARPTTASFFRTIGSYRRS